MQSRALLLAEVSAHTDAEADKEAAQTANADVTSLSSGGMTVKDGDAEAAAAPVASVEGGGSHEDEGLQDLHEEEDVGPKDERSQEAGGAGAASKDVLDAFAHFSFVRRCVCVCVCMCVCVCVCVHLDAIFVCAQRGAADGGEGAAVGCGQRM